MFFKKKILGIAFLALTGNLFSLEVILKPHASSMPIPDSTWKAIEYSHQLWEDRLGFDKCMLNDTVTVFLNMYPAETKPSRAFMYTNSLPYSFPGSRMLKNGGSSTIYFKDRAYVYKGDTYKWNEDAPWFIDSDPEAQNYWQSCDVFADGACNASGQPEGKAFCFITHMAHEFGHVYGFTGSHLFVNTDKENNSFNGIDNNGNTFSFKFSGNSSHAQTSIMKVGFSSWQRAFPSDNELNSLRIVLGYSGMHLRDTSGVVLKANTSTTIPMKFDSSFTVGRVELSNSYFNPSEFSKFGQKDKIAVSLLSPDGQKIQIGPLKMGWARDGFVIPDESRVPSYNPTDAFSGLKGKTSVGEWKIIYENEMDEDFELNGLALILAEGNNPTKLNENKVRKRNFLTPEKDSGTISTPMGELIDPSGKIGQ